MKRPRNLTPAQKVAQRKATLASPWRGQRVCETEKAKELEKIYLDKQWKRWGRE